MFILMFAGFAGVKTGLIRMEGKKAFSDLLVNLICPCMILNSYFAEFQPEIFRNLLWAYGVSLLLILVGLAVTVIFTKKFPHQKDRFSNLPAFIPMQPLWDFP